MDDDRLPTFTIRPGVADDCPKLAGIEESADLRYFDTRLAVLGASPGIPADAALRYCDRGQLLVAEVAGELVGFIIWHDEPNPAYVGIGQVSVVQEHGRRGIGKALMTAATDRIAGTAAQFIALATFTDIPWNDRWYKSLGYEVVNPAAHTDWMADIVTGQVADGLPWDDRVWMVRELD